MLHPPSCSSALRLLQSAVFFCSELLKTVCVLPFMFAIVFFATTAMSSLLSYFVAVVLSVTIFMAYRLRFACLRGV